jgi:hypothetical protein
MLLHKVTSLVGAPVTLDAFACHQSCVCQRYASRLCEPAALASDGLTLDWRHEVVWLNPPWALLPDIIGKLAVEQPAGVLIVPYWTTQTWWVAESPGLRRSSARSSSSPLLRRPASPSPGGTFSAPGSSSLRCRLSRADSDLARAALGVNTRISSCPLIRHAAKLLAHGRRTSRKISYCGKWQRFVDFCTVTLPQFYGQPARSPLPAEPRTVLLYIAHLSTEGLVSESSLNPYMAAINQSHEDLGYNRPALGHYFRLARAGWRTLEGAASDAEGSRSTRMPVPAEVMFDILRLGLTTDDNHTLRLCACLVLCATPGTTTPTRACLSSGDTSLSTFAASQSMFKARLSLGTLPAPFTGCASLAMTLSALFSAFFNGGTTPPRPGSTLVMSVGPSLRIAPFGVPPSSTHGSSSSS